MRRSLLMFGTALLATAAAGAAQADVLEYRYTSSAGEYRTQAATATTFSNAQGIVAVAVNAGLERRVRLSLKKADGTVIQTVESEPITASDRITVGADSYYGVTLSLDAPALDGSYTAVAETLSSDGSVIATDTKSWVIDRVAPTFSDAAYSAWRGYGNTEADWIISTFEARNLLLNDVQDDASGIQGIVFSSQVEGDPTRTTGPFTMNYSKDTLTASIGNGTNFSIPADLLTWGEWNIGRFTVTDKAGNVSRLDHRMYWQQPTKNYEIVGVKDGTTPGANFLPGSPFGGFQAAEGAKIKDLSYEIVVRGRLDRINADLTEKETWHWGTPTPEYTDGTYGYWRQGPHTYNSGTYWTVNKHAWWSTGHEYLPFSLDDSLPPMPAPASVTYRMRKPNGTEYNAFHGIYGLKDAGDQLIGLSLSVAERPYDQYVRFHGWNVNCPVPAGQTTCSLDLTAKGFIVPEAPEVRWFVHSEYHTYRTDDTRYASAYRNTHWDRAFYLDTDPPVIEAASYDPETQVATIQTYDASDGAFWASIHVHRMGVRVMQGGTQVGDTIWAGATSLGNQRRMGEVAVSSLPDGTYELIALAEDTAQNQTTQSLGVFTVDTTEPTVAIKVNGEVPGAEVTVGTLDAFGIQLSDTTTTPRLTEIRLTGGPMAEDVMLSWRQDASGLYRLEYPVMFPSGSAGDYTLKVRAEDEQGNVSVESLSFTYEPRQVAIQGADGTTVAIPAYAYPFRRGDGTEVLHTEPLTLSDGSVLNGQYELYASLSPDATTSLVVNGVTLAPGDRGKSVGVHDFALASGRINLGLSAATDRSPGQGRLLITAAAPNSPVLVADVDVWAPEVVLSNAGGWDVLQGLEPLNITATAAAGTPCRVVGSEQEASETSVIDEPRCHIVWKTIPDEAVADEREPKLTGRAVATGEQVISYDVVVYTLDGMPKVVGSGEQAIQVESAVGAVAMGFRTDIAQVPRVVAPVESLIYQTAGPDCRLTMDEPEAIAAARGSGLSCFFEWTGFPDGLDQDPAMSVPAISGTIQDAGTYEAQWQVSVYTPAGSKILVADQVQQIEAIDPPLPTINATPYRREDRGADVYTVSTAGGYVVDLEVEALNAPLTMTVLANGSEIEVKDFGLYPFGDVRRLRERISAPPTALWSDTSYSIKVAYADLPSVYSETAFRTVTVPSDDIKPNITASLTETLNTEGLPVEIQISDVFNPETGYDPTTMGEWQVRVIHQKSARDLVPLTEFQPMGGDGHIAMTVPLLDVEQTSVRLAAEARLVTDLEGFERTVYSPRALNIAVLRGEAIAADVISRRIVDHAPFQAVFSADLRERLDRSAVGDVKWQVSADDGSTWTDYAGYRTNPLRFVKVFDTGHYKVRAEITNLNTGATFTTEAMDVVAYDIPDLAITGPENIFVGNSGTFALSVKNHNQEVPADGYTVQWSTDNGQTWTDGAQTLTVSRPDEQRLSIMARVLLNGSPADEEGAWATETARAVFAPFREPRVRVQGPRIAEVGKVEDYSVTMALPYRNMEAEIAGEWVLPDGTAQQGDILSWSPPDEALDTGYATLRYRAWVVGNREETETVADQRVRVWQYVWPEWQMHVRQRVEYAPLEATLVIRSGTVNVNRLEEPTFEWSVPAGAEVKDARETVRVLNFAEPGDYPISVTMRDGRGNETTVTETISVLPPPPWTMELEHSVSNAYNRAPLEVLLRPRVSGGHPYDRIATTSYAVDGAAAVEGANSYGTVTLDAGLHTITVKSTTEMGKEVSQAVSLNVVPNQPPSCSLSYRESTTVWYFTADCGDPDGRVMQYEWTVDGTVESLTSYRISVSKVQAPTLPDVSVIAIDDAGGRSETIAY